MAETLPCGSTSLRSTLGVDALAHKWPKALLYAFPPIPLLPAFLKKVRRDKATVLLMAQENLVFKPLPAAAGPDPAAHGSPQSGKRHPLAPRTGQTPTVGLSPEQDCLSALGLSDAVVSTLQNAKASSSRVL
ncbi:UNVERIFIED_CONTAM: hypothetical protein FKN15_039460 [Acipenser sinensis]